MSASGKVWEALFGTPHSIRHCVPVIYVWVVVLSAGGVSVYESEGGAQSFALANAGSKVHQARVQETPEVAMPRQLFKSGSPSASSSSDHGSPPRCSCPVTGLGLMRARCGCPSLSCPDKS